MKITVITKNKRKVLKISTKSVLYYHDYYSKFKITLILQNKTMRRWEFKKLTTVKWLE